MKSPYIPATSEQREAMLKTLNLSSIDELFSAIPDKLKLKEDLKLPGPYSEYELKKEFQSLIRKNSDAASNTCFLGAGVYDHIIPSAVNHIIGRQEFYTSYTPYQAEISQGVLQAMFEYQTMIAELTGMDASNASVYDGASALYEAVLLAARYNNRSEVVVARSVNPEYRKTLSSVLRYSGITVREVGFNIDNDFGGTLDMSELSEAISENTAAVVVQSPNFFGILEDIKSVSEKAKEKRALLICVCDPISLAVFEAPEVLALILQLERLSHWEFL